MKCQINRGISQLVLWTGFAVWWIERPEEGQKMTDIKDSGNGKKKISNKEYEKELAGLQIELVELLVSTPKTNTVKRSSSKP